MAPLLNSNASFWSTTRVLAFLFGVGVIVGFLLTPLGFETRSNELRTLAFAVFFVIVGLLLPIAGLILLFRRPRAVSVLAVIDAALLFLTAPADQAKFFFTSSPPPAVTVCEFILILVGIGYILYGRRLYIENQPNRSPTLT